MCNRGIFSGYKATASADYRLNVPVDTVFMSKNNNQSPMNVLIQYCNFIQCRLSHKNP